MNAVIIGVGNPTKHKDRFEGCRDFIRHELTEVGATLDGFHLVSPQRGEVLDQLRDASRAVELVFVLCAPDPAAAEAVTGAVCQGLRLEPRVDPDLAWKLSNRAAKRERDWSEEEIKAFAAAPVGCTPIPNPAGMVQGYLLTATRQLLLVLPAVQSELTACFESTVRELLAERSEGVTARRTLRAVELGEAPISTLLEPLTRMENPRTVLYDQGGECVINITAAGRTLTEAKNACNGTVHQVADRLGPLLTSAKGEPLAQNVARRLENFHLTLAVAEAGTAGALVSAIKAGSDRDSKVLAGGMNLLTDAQKTERLGVSRKLLSEFGGTSRRVAAAMAVLVRRAARSRLGIAVTCGDPDRSGRRNLVYIALTDGREVWTKKLSFSPDASQEVMGNIAGLQALNMLRLYVQRFPQVLPGGSPVEHAAPGIMTRREKLAAGLSWRLAQVKGLFSGGGEDDLTDNENGEGEANDMNLLQRIIHKKLVKGDGIRLGILGASLAVFIGCLIYIGGVKGESIKNKGIIEDLQSVYGDSSVRPEDVEGFPDSYLPKFASLYAINEDIAGWIQIEGTQYLNLPVVQYYDNTYYERLDFNRQSNQHGIPFVDYRVAQREPSTNTIIYGHNMNDGQMFGELLGYKSVAYYREHPLIKYDSVYYEGVWKIFGVVVCKKDDPDFLYHSFIDKDSDQDMVEFVTKIRERSILNTKVDVRTDDQLLTLSTCDYSFRGENNEREARFVVFARKVREGESLEVDTAGATINTNPVMPEDYYKYLKKQQEEELKRQQEEAAAQAASKWLTAEEQQRLSAEEAQKLAESREKDAQEYLSYDEREMLDLDTMLVYIERRKADFKLFLDEDERGYSLSKRLALVEERYEQARAVGLTDEEIEDAGSWSEIQKLMGNAGTAALDAIISQNPLYLVPGDKSSADTVAKLNDLLAKRKTELAELANQWNLKLSNFTTYDQFMAAVDDAKKKAENQQNQQAEQAQKNAFIESYAKFLTKTEKNLTLAELQALESELKAREDHYYTVRDSLTNQDVLDALEAKFKSASSWEAVESAIEQAQKDDTKKDDNPKKDDEEEENKGGGGTTTPNEGDKTPTNPNEGEGEGQTTPTPGEGEGDGDEEGEGGEDDGKKDENGDGDEDDDKDNKDDDENEDDTTDAPEDRQGSVETASSSNGTGDTAAAS